MMDKIPKKEDCVS